MRWRPHAVGLAACVALGAISFWRYPSLADDPKSTFAFVISWITVFALFVALIEILRAESAASLARQAAVSAKEGVEGLYFQRDLSECRICIENALKSLDENKSVAHSALSRIVFLYSSRFSREYENDSSEVRRHCLIVEGYVVTDAERFSSGSKRLKGALIGMTANIGVANSKSMRGGLL